MEAVKLGKIEMDDVQEQLAPNFYGLFRSLLNLMTIQEKKERDKREKERSKGTSVAAPPTTAGVKRRANEDYEVTAKRVRSSSSATLLAGPTTPDQPTRQSDPFYSLGTLSTTSQDEEGTKTLLFQTLSYTMSALQREFRRIIWPQSPCILEIFETWYHFVSN
jgi:hypothetical protein